ncbi:hypothetical protein BJ170DRAFT_733338 [Xylariales sp. AK1849]|nr:hypothetical protein BJ170DRAFT_733338 [Xylariales sp. AK1849]
MAATNHKKRPREDSSGPDFMREVGGIEDLNEDDVGEEGLDTTPSRPLQENARTPKTKTPSDKTGTVSADQQATVAEALAAINDALKNADRPEIIRAEQRGVTGDDLKRVKHNENDCFLKWHLKSKLKKSQEEREAYLVETAERYYSDRYPYVPVTLPENHATRYGLRYTRKVRDADAVDFDHGKNFGSEFWTLGEANDALAVASDSLSYCNKSKKDRPNVSWKMFKLDKPEHVIIIGLDTAIMDAIWVQRISIPFEQLKDENAPKIAYYKPCITYEVHAQVFYDADKEAIALSRLEEEKNEAKVVQDTGNLFDPDRQPNQEVFDTEEANKRLKALVRELPLQYGDWEDAKDLVGDVQDLYLYNVGKAKKAQEDEDMAHLKVQMREAQAHHLPQGDCLDAITSGDIILHVYSELKVANQRAKQRFKNLALLDAASDVDKDWGLFKAVFQDENAGDAKHGHPFFNRVIVWVSMVVGHVSA